MSITIRGDLNWCDRGYHSIREVDFNGVIYSFGKIGAAECLLDDNLNPCSGDSYHEITPISAGGKVYLIGELGAMKYLLDENGENISGNGYHRIDLVKKEAQTGSLIYHFMEHLGDYSVTIKPKNKPMGFLCVVLVIAFFYFFINSGC